MLTTWEDAEPSRRGGGARRRNSLTGVRDEAPRPVPPPEGTRSPRLLSGQRPRRRPSRELAAGFAVGSPTLAQRAPRPAYARSRNSCYLSAVPIRSGVPSQQRYDGALFADTTPRTRPATRDRLCPRQASPMQCAVGRTTRSLQRQSCFFQDGGKHHRAVPNRVLGDDQE